AALHHSGPIGLACRRRRHRQRARQILARLRPGRRARRDHHLVRGLRHLRCPADPLRPARRPAVREAADPAPAVHRPALLHLPPPPASRAPPPGGRPRPPVPPPPGPGPRPGTTSRTPRAWRSAGGAHPAPAEPAGRRAGPGTAGSMTIRPSAGPFGPAAAPLP